jgi:multicomponent K+:H+ antiporter subunit A
VPVVSYNRVAMSLPLVVLLPLLLGTAGVIAARHRGITTIALMAALPAAIALGLVIAQWPAVAGGRFPELYWPWVPQLGLELAFRMDGLSMLFALLILGIGLLIILYARYYLGKDDPPVRFYGQLLLFMASMLGIVVSDNLLLLVLFWELTSVSSFLLVGYWDRRADARQGARMALAVTGGGGLALLAGALLLGDIAGTYRISELGDVSDQIQAHALFPLALILVLLGAFTKSAQFPFHFWLPEAMAAPTPVSAYLHSATLVKAGIFLIARLYPAIGGNELFEYLVTGTGLVTLVFAAFVAIFKHDLKGLLAYSTVSHLGLIIFLLGLDSPLSSLAAVFHVVNHATFKASLFMAAGIIDHETGTRDMRRLSGLWAYMPYTATLAMVAAASMAGVPLLNGFLSKEMFFDEALQARDLAVIGTIVPYAVTLAGIFSVAYSLRFVHDVFFDGNPVNLPKKPHEPPRYMKVPVEVLVLVCVAVGMLPGITVQPLVDLAALAVYGAPLPPHDIAIFHGFNLPLLMSTIALAGGVLLYFVLVRRLNLHIIAPSGWTGRLFFHRVTEATVNLARSVTARMENGSLQRYLALLFGAALILMVYPLVRDGLPALEGELSPPDLPSVIATIVLAGATLTAVVLQRQRVTALVAVAGAGLIVVLAFVHLSAPDLALTQLCVEVVSTVLLLLGLGRLPQSSPVDSSAGLRLGHGLIALGSGTAVGLLAWSTLMRPSDSIAWFLLEQSVPKGGGANVVNVILVDFRGFDTFGEITVVAIAALGVAALMGTALAGGYGAPPTGSAERIRLLPTAAWFTLPFALMISAYLFLRGHNAPGGGFIAGLVAASGLFLQRIAGNFTSANADRLVRLTGTALAIAMVTGIGAMLIGFPFLTSAHGYAELPWFGKVPLASAVAFDVGVYGVVVGATLLMLHVIAGIRPGAPLPRGGS